jgi:hypothetical protein
LEYLSFTSVLYSDKLFSNIQSKPSIIDELTVHAVVIPSGECRFAYGDTQPPASLAGSVAYNQDTIENPTNSKLWLRPTIRSMSYVVHEF